LLQETPNFRRRGDLIELDIQHLLFTAVEVTTTFSMQLVKERLSEDANDAANGMV
jgi:hypothetical protein